MTTTDHPSGLPEHEEHDMTEQPTCTTLPDGSKEWYLNGERHRTDGPAIERADGTKQWSLNGRLHRTDGPAIERADGSKQWYVDDKRLTEAEHAKRTA